MRISRSSLIAALPLLSSCAAPAAQPSPSAGFGWTMQTSGTTASLRGLSVVSRDVAWASGSGGTFLRTVDGGATWRADTVPGASKLDFRDVQAFDERTAVLLTAGQPARIYRTEDGGRRWTVVHTEDAPAAFFDGMAFWDARNGIAFSDPVDGHFLIVTTGDGGRTWTRVPPESIPAPLAGEAAFAASGTAVSVHGSSDAWIATGGGRVARVLHTPDRGRTWSVAELPFAGNETSGAFSAAFRDGGTGVAVGGDYRREREGGDAARSTDGGRTWMAGGRVMPPGVREGVVYVPGARRPTVVAVGPGGSSWSVDDGATWMPIDTAGFHAVGFAAPDAGWAVGAGGRVARFTGALPGTTRP
jgi:photosystem II stability/assembly factor-like uncharacterized protein